MDDKANQIEELKEALLKKEQEFQVVNEMLEEVCAQLVKSEKMAVLGNLIAGIIHEINSPLGAIKASIFNMQNYMEKSVMNLPFLTMKMDEATFEQFVKFLNVVHKVTLNALSTKEEREKKYELRKKFEEMGIQNGDILGDYIAEMGMYDECDNFEILLRSPNNQEIFKSVYGISGLFRNLSNISIASEKANRMIFSLKTYSRSETENVMEKVNVIDGIEVILNIYHNQLKHGVTIVRNYSKVPCVMCFPDQLTQVWTNIIQNAAHAMENKGTLEIEVCEEGDNVRVSITDSGIGIPDDIKDKIFKPFFTTKNKGEGTGLGLDIVKKIVEKHNGSIEFESIPGRTTFTVILPSAEVVD